MSLEKFFKIYHFSHYLLHELGAFFHFGSWAPKLNDVAFLCWVGEVDDDLRRAMFIVIKVNLMSSVQTRYTSQYKQSPTHLWEFIAHFLYLLPFLADDGSVKTLFDDQVLCTLILLREKENEYEYI